MEENPEKKWLKEHKIIPKLFFEPNKPENLRILKRKQEIFKLEDGKEVDGIKYLVEDENTKEIKTFFTSSVSLISQLADIPNGEVIVIQQKKKKTPEGKYKTTYKVEVLKKNKEKDEIISNDDIPVIEEGEELTPEEQEEMAQIFGNLEK